MMCPHILHVSTCFYVYLLKRFLTAFMHVNRNWTTLFDKAINSQHHILLSSTLHATNKYFLAAAAVA